MTLKECVLIADAGAGTYLDVVATEPLPPSSSLWELDNVLLTPHCADRARDWRERLAELFMDDLERRLAGRPLLDRVIPEPAQRAGLP